MSTTTADLPIDLRSEQLLSLPQAARRFPPYRRGRPVNPSTVWRWVFVGVRLPGGRRVRLDAVRLSGRWLTSVEAIERFIRAQTPRLGETAGTPAPRTPGRRRRDSERAAAELGKAGI
jgi:hypothetical protein